ncbi:hypothetical protein EHI8A_003390 [Entamoeba histolytica HM-1:IMSS-B]|uniref:VHS domain-containing protein n=6 Tax=Entamoeba histolytica TaxID=5759 RepID=C4LZV9_ENTH1|nr:hypothetical protein EHI_194470 [Entamoeba histolytica HM-1:IMSS]EMD47779.1 Hypothetical protein EHI5A_011920 [Entamoeba histolytica KU27]EMH74928.1 hypothetical protein EHI8A_003390 [Entamoeba histolytica HM-1:IMSS-B]EMS14003.1 hypothetical protein KM1_013500 [Entamoeba histolytica HM-3:IMSS]ENY64547.1 hypothetical protein EHI7A_005220 [Entamoeba histolytica HM-1:IMSS-A]GAT94419.1 hypothetical protein CL6EHI_194470 [Entamoeba histolytica]|eukprot:XP_654693.1 hypothetical protein EHI_194470 [Entamoeba histolytica HM-1:IMSS]
MSKGKQTVPLSQIVDHATNEIHPSPSIKAYATLAKIAATIPSAQVALRVQLITKMKAYCNGFLPKKEMYYCLCLVDYLVLNCPQFRPQVLNPDFVTLFERSADFEKCKKSKKPGIVTEKAMRILQTWGPLYPNELYDYQLMYDKYISKGVYFPVLDKLPEQAQPEHSETLADDLEKSTKEINECSELIQDALENTGASVRTQSVKALYKRAVELNSKFNVLFVKYINTTTNTEEIQKYSELESNFTRLIVQLANIINNPQGEDIYRTYTTGHITDKTEDKHTKLRSSQAPLDPISIATSSAQKETPSPSNFSRKNSSFQLAPPPSRGQPIRFSRQNTEPPESQLFQNSPVPSTKISMETQIRDDTDSVVKNRFIFDQSSPSYQSNHGPLDQQSLL